jgi:hypothetical protein
MASEGLETRFYETDMYLCGNVYRTASSRLKALKRGPVMPAVRFGVLTNGRCNEFHGLSQLRKHVLITYFLILFAFSFFSTKV